MQGSAAWILANSYTKNSLKGAGALKGDKGDSAYQIAVKNGFSGTEKEWLESLKIVETVIYVDCKTQSGTYNVNEAIEECIPKVLASEDAKDGVLISLMQPFNGGSTEMLGSGYIIAHKDNVWSGSIVFSVPTTITSINIIGTYDFQYIESTKQLAIERTIHNDDLKTYAVALQQDKTKAGMGLIIGPDGKVIPGTVAAEVAISKLEDNILSKDEEGKLYVPATDISNLVEKEDGKSLVADTDISQITANKNAITTLNGTGTGSVSKQIADEIAKLTYLSKVIATKTEIDSYVADPTKAKFNVIYLLKDASTKGSDKYFEYQRLGDETISTFEMTGDTSTDLSDYVKKDGTKVLSTNDYDDDSKDKVDAIPENPKYTDTVYDDTEIREDLHNLSYNEIAGGKNLANDILFDESKYVLRDTTWSYVDASSILAHKKFTASMKDNPNLSELNCGFGTDSTIDPVVANRFITSGNIKSVTYDFGTSDKVYLFVATAGGYISTKLNKMLNALSTRLQVEIGDTATDYEQHIKSNATLTNEISRKELELAELKMLGWTVPSECPIQNEVNSNIFTQRVGRVELGALNWGINAYATPTAFSLHENIDLPDLVSISDNKEENVRCYSPSYDCDSAGKVTGTTRTYTFCVITGKRLYVRADVTTAEELKAELKDKYIYYELETPITKQIDGGEIVENLTDQGLINKAVWHQGSINYSSGAIVTSTTAIYSDEIPCKQGDLISVANMENSGENIVMVYYNASGYVGKDVGKLQFTVPANVTKFRANYRKTSTPNSNAKVFVNNVISKMGFTKTVIKDYEITVSANSVGQLTLDSSQTNNLFAVANIPYNGTDGFVNVEPSLIYVRNVTNQERLFRIRVMAFF